MESDKRLQLLFQYACEYKFDAFHQLFDELAASLPKERLLDAYLMRAQIKLSVSDEALLDDLEQAEEIGGNPQFPSLSQRWPSDAPNRFVVFPTAPAALPRFSQMLPRAEKMMRHWFGETGGTMVRQIKSEIFYFSGEYDEAIRLAKEHSEATAENCTQSILAQCALFRCYLATGASQKAEDCMLTMIRISKTYPECLGAYESIRKWANLTTGWSGENPRFYHDDDTGVTHPVLEDRLEAIRSGYSRTSQLEEPFVRYAESQYENMYTMRRFYMDIFQALYWFQAKDYQEAQANFSKAYRLASASGLIMPFVEYGSQITPLLRHIQSQATPCPPEWASKILSLAEQYEENLNAYRT